MRLSDLPGGGGIPHELIAWVAEGEQRAEFETLIGFIQDLAWTADPRAKNITPKYREELIQGIITLFNLLEIPDDYPLTGEEAEVREQTNALMEELNIRVTREYE